MTAPPRTLQERLRELKALLEKATPGPWEWTKIANPCWGNNGPDLRSVTMGKAWDDYWGPEGNAVGKKQADMPPTPTILSAWGHDAWGINVEQDNADLLIAARNDLPELIAALDAQSQLLAEARDALEKADYYIDRLRAAWMKKPVRDLDEASVAYESARAVLGKLKAASGE